MESVITVTPGKGAEDLAGKALEAFKSESQGLLPYLEGISVHLGEEAGAAGRQDKSIRVRVDFRRGGRYLVEAQGEDWARLIPEAARRASRGAERELHHRWEMAA